MNPTPAVDNAVPKVISVWALVGITSWTDVASALAAIYSAVLIGEWAWKTVIRPFAVSRGWIKPKPNA